MRVRIPYVHEDRDRHGNVRLYFKRPGGAKIRIRAEIGSEAFWSAYNAAKAAPAKAGARLNDPLAKPVAGTFRALCVDYMASAAYRTLDPRTQRTRKGVVDAMLAEPIAPDSDRLFADFPVARMTKRAITVLRDRKADLPGAADQRMRALRTIFAWAADDDYPGVAADIARDVAYIRPATNGWHTWSLEDVAQFEAHWPRGTKARLALDILLYTGLRRSDAVLVGRQHERVVDGQRWLHLTLHKGRRRTPTVLDIPLLADLDAALREGPVGDLTYLVTAYGRPFSADGFGIRFRGWCDKAGLPHCSAHGLRKAGATRAAEGGASTWQLMSIFGWKDTKQAEVYTRTANRRKMAGDAMGLLSRRTNSA